MKNKTTRQVCIFVVVTIIVSKRNLLEFFLNVIAIIWISTMYRKTFKIRINLGNYVPVSWVIRGFKNFSNLFLDPFLSFVGTSISPMASMTTNKAFGLLSWFRPFLESKSWPSGCGRFWPILLFLRRRSRSTRTLTTLVFLRTLSGVVLITPKLICFSKGVTDGGAEMQLLFYILASFVGGTFIFHNDKNVLVKCN